MQENVQALAASVGQLSDQQLQQAAQRYQQDPMVLPLINREVTQRVSMRQQATAQQAAPQPTVAEQTVQKAQQLTLPENVGIGQLPAGSMQFADGGIVGYAGNDPIEGSVVGGTYGETDRARLRAYARQRAAEMGVDPDLADRMFSIESQYNPVAVSKTGPVGVGQLTRNTAIGYGLRPEERTDPIKNIDASLRFMADLTKKYGGDPQKIAVGYNRGETVLDKHLKANNGQLNIAALDAEPRNYLQKAGLLGERAPAPTTAAPATAGTQEASTPIGRWWNSLSFNSPDEKARSALLNEHAKRAGLFGLFMEQTPEERARSQEITKRFGWLSPATGAAEVLANDPVMRAKQAPPPAAKATSASTASATAPTVPSVPSPGITALQTAPLGQYMTDLRSAMGDEQYAEQRRAIERAREDAAMQSAIERMQELKARDDAVAARSKAFEGREERLKKQEGKIAENTERNKGMSLLQAGLAMMQARGPGLSGIAAGAEKGLGTYAAGVERIKADEERIDDLRSRIDDARRAEELANERDRFAVTDRHAQETRAERNARLATQEGALAADRQVSAALAGKALEARGQDYRVNTVANMPPDNVKTAQAILADPRIGSTLLQLAHGKTDVALKLVTEVLGKNPLLANDPQAMLKAVHAAKIAYDQLAGGGVKAVELPSGSEIVKR